MNKKPLVIILTALAMALILAPLTTGIATAQDEGETKIVLLREVGSFRAIGPVLTHEPDFSMDRNKHAVSIPRSGTMYWALKIEDDPAVKESREALKESLQKPGCEYLGLVSPPTLLWPGQRIPRLALRGELGHEVTAGETVTFEVGPDGGYAECGKDVYYFCQYPMKYQLTVIMGKNHSPTCSFEINPKEPTPDDSVKCVSTSTDPDGDPLTCSWYLGNEKVGDGPQVELGKLALGSYTIQLFVTDDMGSTESCHRLIVITEEAINHHPECSFDIAPSNPTPDDPVVCVSTSTDPDGDPLTYEWYLNGKYGGDFPSCELGTLEPGEYTITLYINDGREGTDECSQMMMVSSQPSGGGMGCAGTGYSLPRGSFDISPFLLGVVWIALLLGKQWKRNRR